MNKTVEILTEIAKHLPGQHDQESHAGKGQGAEESIEGVSGAKSGSGSWEDFAKIAKGSGKTNGITGERALEVQLLGLLGPGYGGSPDKKTTRNWAITRGKSKVLIWDYKGGLGDKHHPGVSVYSNDNGLLREIVKQIEGANLDR